MYQVYSVFDLTVREVVGMTAGDFSPVGYIQYCLFRIRSWYGRGCGHDWS